ncbi:hypothetical protein IEQ34_005504 [Dendrobium chrysotoxum]|uniref:UBC core domain-containing protein n=1 Tax=Dendrobium chrysotoxum TaxID=161865 RepID=A0AAV7H939_DENCH|nr:hypothetical protein IEQ34_005504 [Dendrobium chrysotoxum]
MWAPSRRISDIIEAIRALLTEPRLDDPLEQEITNMYKNNRAEYDRVARLWTDRHAKRLEAADAQNELSRDAKEFIELGEIRTIDLKINGQDPVGPRIRAGVYLDPAVFPRSNSI